MTFMKAAIAGKDGEKFPGDGEAAAALKGGVVAAAKPVVDGKAGAVAAAKPVVVAGKAGAVAPVAGKADGKAAAAVPGKPDGKAVAAAPAKGVAPAAGDAGKVHAALPVGSGSAPAKPVVKPALPR
jgi:hypothetical protein